MALTDVYDQFATQSRFKQRVASALAKSALDILNEDIATANHAERAAWALDTLRNPLAMSESMTWGVLSNATVAAAFGVDGSGVADNDITFVVDSMITNYAIALAAASV